MIPKWSLALVGLVRTDFCWIWGVFGRPRRVQPHQPPTRNTTPFWLSIFYRFRVTLGCQLGFIFPSKTAQEPPKGCPGGLQESSWDQEPPRKRLDPLWTSTLPRFWYDFEQCLGQFQVILPASLVQNPPPSPSDQEVN